MDRAAARGQRDGVGAAVVGRGADRDQAAFLQNGEIAAKGPLSKPITLQIRAAGMPGSIASSSGSRHSVTLTPKWR